MIIMIIMIIAIIMIIMISIFSEGQSPYSCDDYSDDNDDDNDDVTRLLPSKLTADTDVGSGVGLPTGRILHTVENPVPDIISYPSAHVIPVIETLSMYDVQSPVLAQEALAAF